MGDGGRNGKKKRPSFDDEVGSQKRAWLRFGVYSKNRRGSSYTFPNLRIRNQAVREAHSPDPKALSLLLVTNLSTLVYLPVPASPCQSLRMVTGFKWCSGSRV